jgi:hypothetical protein
MDAVNNFELLCLIEHYELAQQAYNNFEKNQSINLSTGNWTSLMTRFFQSQNCCWEN